MSIPLDYSVNLGTWFLGSVILAAGVVVPLGLLTYRFVLRQEDSRERSQ